MIVIISDIHLGYEKCNTENFKRFIDFLTTQEIDHLVLLGDILDFWRRSANNVVKENEEILDTLANIDAEKHYVVGNHDYALLYTQGLPFEFTKTLTLTSGNKQFRFIHGYQIEFQSVLEFYEGICEVLCTSGDGTGEILSDVWDFYEQKLRKILKKEGYSECWRYMNRGELDRIVKYVLKYPEEEPLHREFTAEQITQYRETAGLDPEEVLVYGHTHSPCVKKTEANAGCWISDCNYLDSFLVINGGRVFLNSWR